MKKLLFLLFLIPSMVFSQRVSSWRSSAPTTPRVSSSSSNVSSWRNQSPSTFNRPQPNRPVIITNPWHYGGWRPNMWHMWGAPHFGYSYWSPMWYTNSWGYRQPARVYVYENGRKDTIKGKKPIISFGVHKTSNNQIGAYFASGNKAYFIADVVSTYAIDRSTFFPHGTINLIDFPLISDLKKQYTIHVGGGVRHERLGVHAMVGFGTETVRWRGIDSYGEITFPKYKANFLTIKMGVMYDIKNITIKYDRDPIRKYSQLGFGFNL